MQSSWFSLQRPGIINTQHTPDLLTGFEFAKQTAQDVSRFMFTPSQQAPRLPLLDCWGVFAKREAQTLPVFLHTLSVNNNNA